MSSRMFVNGRVYEFSRGDPPLAAEEFPQPFGRIWLEDPNYKDGPWDLRYRLLDRALESDGWLTMPEALRLLSVKEPWIAARVRSGQIDAAMVRGSTIPLFRLRDKAAIVREALLDRPPAIEGPRRKARWDKE